MNTVISGPAILTWNGTTYYTEGDIVVNFERRTRQIRTAQHGLVGNRHQYSIATITFTPSGIQTEGTEILDHLTTRAVGQSLVPGGTGAELALVITPVSNSGGASKIWTFPRAGFTAWGGGIRVASGQTQWGAMTFTALESIVTPGSFYSTASYSAPTLSFTPANVITLPCRLYYAVDQGTLASGDLLMDSVAGWSIAVNLATQQHERDTCGIADITFQDLTFTITGQAASIYDYLAALMEESAWPGVMEFQSLKPGQVPVSRSIALKTLSADAATADVAASGDTLFSFANAEMTKCGYNWGASSNRSGNVEFISRPKFTTGAKGAVMGWETY